MMRDDATIETTEKLGSRALAWWKDTILPLARDSKSGLSSGTEPTTLNVLAASHGGWISTFFSAAVAQGLIALSPGVAFTRCWNTSVSIVEIDETLKGSVTAYADISHLLRKDVVETNVDEVEVESAPSGGESGGSAAALSDQLNGLI
jgi:probable phosphoglycerate mutase